MSNSSPKPASLNVCVSRGGTSWRLTKLFFSLLPAVLQHTHTADTRPHKVPRSKCPPGSYQPWVYHLFSHLLHRNNNGCLCLGTVIDHRAFPSTRQLLISTSCWVQLWIFRSPPFIPDTSFFNHRLTRLFYTPLCLPLPPLWLQRHPSAAAKQTATFSVFGVKNCNTSHKSNTTSRHKQRRKWSAFLSSEEPSSSQ